MASQRLKSKSYAEDEVAVASLKGKVVVVTGATSGIGEELATSLAGRGAKVVLTWRNRKKVDNTFKKVMEHYPKADVVIGPHIDFSDQSSIRQFVSEFRELKLPIHILVNNAGALTAKPEYTVDGVPLLAQQNYLGHYTMTRLLEDILIQTKARIVTVASVTHRYGELGPRGVSARTFLTDIRHGNQYRNTKKADVFLAYELQRRLGPYGVQSCAVDPGGVRSDVWRDVKLLQMVVDLIYAPVEDGAVCPIFAATVPWDDPAAKPWWYPNLERPTLGKLMAQVVWPILPRPLAEQVNRLVANPDKHQLLKTPFLDLTKPAHVPDSEDLRYFARGWFGSPFVTWFDKTSGLINWVEEQIWDGLAMIVSAFDWPTRRLTRGLFFSTSYAVPSAPSTYDRQYAKELWNLSAEIARVPQEVQKKAH